MRDDLLQYLMWNSLAGGGGAASAQLWLQIVFLVCLFGTAVLRPEAIRNKALFRSACVMFVFSLLISPSMNFLMGYVMQISPGGMMSPTRGPADEAMLLMSAPSLVASVLFGLSVLCALLSLGIMPSRRGRAGSGAPVAEGPSSGAPRTLPTGWGEAEPPAARVHPLDEPD
jgi:hypothetical protein